MACELQSIAHMLPTFSKEKMNADQNECKNAGMEIIWREREHQDMDQEVMCDPLTLNALRRCGLLKFFRMMNMWAQLRLLETLVSYWDPRQGVFDLQG